MASSILRLEGYYLRCFFAGIFRSCSIGLGGRMISNLSGVSPSSTLPSPGLMLPPCFEGGANMVYRFYDLAKKELQRFEMGGGGGGEEELQLADENDFKFVGSSHGWLALFNRRNNDLFLSNPVSGRQIKLPPIHTLPDPHINLRRGRGSVSKVIISCSPDDDEEECRAMMSFGPLDRLAFCWPGHSTHWTPIGDLFLNDGFTKTPQVRYASLYEDFAYCSRTKHFHCITHSSGIDMWDLTDPDSPDRYWTMILQFEFVDRDRWDIREPRSELVDWEELMRQKSSSSSSWWWRKENIDVLRGCRQIPYLVFPDKSEEDPWFVMRFVENGSDSDAYNTVGFFVYKYHPDIGLTLKLEEDSLDGLAIFVGDNHSFAVPADEFPQLLKPNSIYFTEARQWPFALAVTPPVSKKKKNKYRLQDVRMFNYEKKTFNPFYYPGPLDTGPSPIWFTPSPP